MIKKLHYPSFFDITPVTIIITDGLNEDGTEKEIITFEVKSQDTVGWVQYQDSMLLPLYCHKLNIHNILFLM